MKKISFNKYVLCGNKFVLLDETGGKGLTEEEKSRFAYPATDPYFGIASDNLLIIQEGSRDNLTEINTNRKYWNAVPENCGADFIFRMFEPDGSEAFSCGNGLTCISSHLHRKYGMDSATILTEIPTGEPRILQIGTEPDSGINWVNMGKPRRFPDCMVHPDAVVPHNSIIYFLKELEIQIDFYGLAEAVGLNLIKLKGFIVNTGEPHLVIFTDSGIVPGSVADLFFQPDPAMPFHHTSKIKVDIATQIIHYIGMTINRDFRHLFPHGLNVNFVHVPKEADHLEYRCFERGINRETWACGTGALACFYIARQMRMILGDQIEVWPHLCHISDPDAVLHVKALNGDGYLYGHPQHLFSGVFNFQHSRIAGDNSPVRAFSKGS